MWKAFCRKIDTKTDDYGTILCVMKVVLAEPFASAIANVIFAKYWSAASSEWQQN